MNAIQTQTDQHNNTSFYYATAGNILEGMILNNHAVVVLEGKPFTATFDNVLSGEQKEKDFDSNLDAEMWILKQFHKAMQS